MGPFPYNEDHRVLGARPDIHWHKKQHIRRVKIGLIVP
jgi:hypothetical protein